MKPDLRSVARNAMSSSLWFVPVAVLFALALFACATSLFMPTRASAPMVAAGAPASAPTNTAWPVEHTPVDWDKLPVEPDPSPRSVAAYRD